MTENITSSNVIDRCLAAATCCMELGNDRMANAIMKAAFRELAREVSRWQLSGEAKAGLFLTPMEEELVSRHGNDIGRMLYADFVEAFWIQTWIDMPLDSEKLERSIIQTTDLHDRVQTSNALRRRIANQNYASPINDN